MNLRFLLLLLLLLSSSFAVTCSIDKRIMFSIAQVEKHPKRVVGYPYLISFNNNEDALYASYIFPEFFMDKRTMDCEGVKQCAIILDELHLLGIRNLDCGTYQINTKYWKLPLEDYFKLQTSYKKACTIIEHHTKDDLSWENIASYHSKTKKYNEKYKKRLFEALEKNMKK